MNIQDEYQKTRRGTFETFILIGLFRKTETSQKLLHSYTKCGHQLYSQK